MARYTRKDIACPVELTFNIVGGRWKAIILWHLLDLNVLRFGELKRLVSEGIGTEGDTPAISKRILSKQLSELEEDGLILRIPYPGKIAKVEYQITEKGKSLEKIILLSYQWGTEEKKRMSMEN